MSNLNQVGTWVRRGSLAAGIAFTATAEYELARRLGAQPPIAVMLPLALDCYVIAALRWFRAFDIALSLALMGAAQVAAHALEAGVIKVSLDLVTVVSLLVPISLWRTHALARQTPRDATPPATVPPVPETPPDVQQDIEYTLDRNEQQDTGETLALGPGTGQDTEDAPTPPPVLLTSKDVADRYGVDPSTVRSWVANGTLKVHDKTPRGHNLFHPDELPQEARS
ncbi:helix-turn-helix domain-containing protein [Streptomyces sp. 7R007]